MKTWLRATVVVFAIGFYPALAAAKLTKTGGDSQVKFTTALNIGPKLEGKTSEITVSEQDDKVVLVVPLAKVDTGDTSRNGHMRDKYLEVQKFPNAELSVAKGALKLPDAGGADTSGTIPGTMKIHGVSKPVQVTYSVHREGNVFNVKGSTALRITDYGIEQPSLGPVKVKPDVALEVHFKATDG